MAAYVGARVKIKTEEGEFSGSVYDVEPNVRRLTLDDVALLPSGKKVQGLRHFFGDELLSIESLSSDDALASVEGKLSEKEKKSVKENGEEDQGYHLLEEGEPVPPGVTVISDASGTFQEMIAELTQEGQFGVAFFGSGYDRFGSLSLVLINTSSKTYLIDALKASPALFVEGLGTVLESPDVLKVMHDCRWASDMLYHQFSVKLANVFDTQVADSIILKQKNGHLDQMVSSLPDCMLAHLGEDFQQVYSMNQMEISIVPDDWQERPLRKGLFHFAFESVRRLLQLRRVLLQKLLAEFNVAVGIYLSTERNALNQGKAVKKGKVKHLPPEFNNWHHKLPSLLETEYLQCTDTKHSRKERHQNSGKINEQHNGSAEEGSTAWRPKSTEERNEKMTNSDKVNRCFDPQDSRSVSPPLRISIPSPSQRTPSGRTTPHITPPQRTHQATRDEMHSIRQEDTKRKTDDGTKIKSSFISFGRGKPKVSADIYSEVPKRTEKSPLSPQGRGTSLSDDIRWKKGRGRGFYLDTTPPRNGKFVQEDSYQMKLQDRSSIDFPTSEEILEAEKREVHSFSEDDT
ncbi:piRNA biogenesis protein EXD1 [Holothuria leucospilota]|uniref:PiRNA biogenesis protein EXD1 n=1 Tax=Holothuria leucospilota TaxID=206669 RepID=A0A9Q1GZX1_HOLLE|nr:piRNA biogenesis protein EXD1 [Holothuria leucospilota]